MGVPKQKPKQKPASKEPDDDQAAKDQGPGKVPRTPGQHLWDWVKSLAIALAIWFVLQAMLVKAFRIPSGSMEETILIGDWLFVNKAIYGAQIPLIGKRLPSIREPRRNDIVVFRSPVPLDVAARLEIEANVDVVKRLVAGPGDTLQMRRDSLFLNGAYVDEPYTRYSIPRQFSAAAQQISRQWQLEHFAGTPPNDYVPALSDWGPVVVPPDEYFVMGDNRYESVDSRYWGFLPRESIQGKTLFVYYSWDNTSWRPLPFVTAIRWSRLFHVPR